MKLSNGRRGDEDAQRRIIREIDRPTRTPTIRIKQSERGTGKTGCTSLGTGSSIDKGTLCAKVKIGTCPKNNSDNQDYS